MLALLLQRRFLPFFICQFCGALNDSIFRLALVAMLAFGTFKSDLSHLFIVLSAGIFMLPFFLFSAAAGDIADNVSKRQLLIAVKSAEVVFTILAAVAIYWQSLPLALLCLLLAGTQSAFFGPIKYALLPVLLKREELLNGNAWFSVSTFAAILGGTIFGTIGGKLPQLAAVLAGGLITLSLAGLAAAFWVPVTEEQPPQRMRFKPIKSFSIVFTAARADKKIFHCILAGSWFWLVGAMLLNELAQMPYEGYTALLAAALSGTAIGALSCSLLFRGAISVKYAPLTLFLGGVLLFIISQQFDTSREGVPYALAVAVALFATVMTLYVVPLRTIVQARADLNKRAKTIAAYNIFNALFIVCATIIAAIIHEVATNPSAVVLLATCLLSLAGVLPVRRIANAIC